MKPSAHRWPLIGGLLILLLSIGCGIFSSFAPTNVPADACPYAGPDDTQTFTNIIYVEEQSVLNEDLNTIRSIYADGATITDVGTGETWTDISQHYQGLFDKMDFTRITHFDLKVVKNDGTNAWVKATDSGTFIWSENGQEIEYNSDPGSNHLIFEKDTAGCWRIKHFSKDAASERFP